MVSVISVGTLLAFSRLSGGLLHKYSPLESLNLAFKKECTENGTHCDLDQSQR
jgi:hypothetical protein